MGLVVNVLVCSKVSIPAKDRTLPAWEYLRSLGHTVVVEHPDGASPSFEPDVIISMGITIMEETFEAIARWPSAPLFYYNWDAYAWVWTNPRPGEYDYKRYGDLLRKATEVWVPSECTLRRTKQWWDIDNVEIVLSACPYWDYDDVEDECYALCCLREIPDPYWGMLEKACRELRIPCMMTQHEATYEQYQKAVAHCRFLVSPLYELSTGGLTLMEGYYLGKPCLLSDSQWHGGKDYMGKRAEYFRYGDYEHFKFKLSSMYNDPPVLNRDECKRWVVENFSDQRMIDDFLHRIGKVISV